MKITGEPKFQESDRVWGSNINSHFTNGDPEAEKSSGTGPGLQSYWVTSRAGIWTQGAGLRSLCLLTKLACLFIPESAKTMRIKEALGRVFKYMWVWGELEEGQTGTATWSSCGYLLSQQVTNIHKDSQMSCRRRLRSLVCSVYWGREMYNTFLKDFGLRDKLWWYLVKSFMWNI